MKKFINPFSIAFVVGIVTLTVLPILQRRFLKAPPPIGTLPSWSMTSLDTGAPVATADVAGHVLLATLAPDDCDALCVERNKSLGRALQHTDDLGDKIQLVTFARPQRSEALKGQANGRWRVLTGAPEQVDPVLNALRASWGTFAGTDAGSTAHDFARLPAYFVVDQTGAVRGFWRDDVAGRGNAINAARLLAKYGANP